MLFFIHTYSYVIMVINSAYLNIFSYKGNPDGRTESNAYEPTMYMHICYCISNKVNCKKCQLNGKMNRFRGGHRILGAHPWSIFDYKVHW